MEFFDVIDIRRSVRAFADDPIPEEALERILAAASRGPSASNRQPWHLIVVSDRRTREAIAAGATYGKFLTQSPVVVVGLGDPNTAPKWYAVDTAIALEHVVLAATAEGLGSCWIGSLDEAKVKELLGIPEALRVVAMIALGYPRKALDLAGAANKLLRPSKSLDELVSRGAYASAWSDKNR